MPGIGIINNPRSKKNLLYPDRIRKLGYLLGERGESKATKSLEELEDCLGEFKKQKIDILAINGGDGSNHVTLTKLVKLWGRDPLPKIALLRGGTLNTIARSFGINGRPEYILHNIAGKYSEGLPFKTTVANLLCVNGKYSFLFGNGVVANFMKHYYDTGKPSPSHGVKVVAEGVFSAIAGTPLAKKWLKPVVADVTIDGEKQGLREFTSILAATIEDIGVGFKPWFRAFDEMDNFHILLFHGSAVQIIKEMPYFYFGRPPSPRLTAETLAKHVHLEAEEPFSYTLDGDMYECEDGIMDLSIGPRVEIILD